MTRPDVMTRPAKEPLTVLQASGRYGWAYSTLMAKLKKGELQAVGHRPPPVGHIAQKGWILVDGAEVAKLRGSRLYTARRPDPHRNRTGPRRRR